jgi:predicted thioesterase
MKKMAELKAGIKGNGSVVVVEENTARAMGSGQLPVFATPAMIALMEKTASESVLECLEEGCGSVGTSLNVKHVSATPLGMEVSCESELVEVDGRRLVFSVKAFDEAGLIGEGTHERFVIKNESFLKKAEGKNK